MMDTIQTPQHVAFVPVDQLASLIEGIVHKQIRQKQSEDLQEKLLAPKEVCKLFQPNISLVTLDSWADKGLLTKHYIGGRTYYKYSEVINSVKSLKKYTRK